MTKIFRFKEHNVNLQLAEMFLNMVCNPRLHESTENQEVIKSILKNLQQDLKFNVKLIFTFGTGIASMYPIVLNLIKNQNLKIDLTPESVTLLTLTTIVILYNEISRDESINKDDIKTLLTELKLRGIGNGIVKKMVQCFKSLGNIINILFKNTGKTIRHLIDMFAYTSLLIPTMTAINYLVTDNNWTMETVIGNLSSLGVGLLTFLAKNGWDYLINKLKTKTQLNPDIEGDIVVEPDFGDTTKSNQTKMINEQ